MPVDAQTTPNGTEGTLPGKYELPYCPAKALYDVPFYLEIQP